MRLRTGIVRSYNTLIFQISFQKFQYDYDLHELVEIMTRPTVIVSSSAKSSVSMLGEQDMDKERTEDTDRVLEDQRNPEVSLLAELSINVSRNDQGTPVEFVEVAHDEDVHDEDVHDEDVHDEDVLDEDVEAADGGERPKRRRTKKLRRDEMLNERERKIEKFKLAKEDMKNGKFTSGRACAKYHGVSEATLRRLLKAGKDYKGKTESRIMKKEEEVKLVTHVKMMAKRG